MIIVAPNDGLHGAFEMDGLHAYTGSGNPSDAATSAFRYKDKHSNIVFEAANLFGRSSLGAKLQLYLLQLVATKTKKATSKKVCISVKRIILDQNGVFSMDGTVATAPRQRLAKGRIKSNVRFSYFMESSH